MEELNRAIESLGMIPISTTSDKEKILVLLNFSDKVSNINVVSEIDSLSNGNYEILLSNYNRTSM